VFTRLAAVLSLLSLSLALAASTASGAQAGPVPANKEQSRTAQSNAAGPAQVYFYWPREGIDPGWLDSIKPDIEIVIDGRKAGAMTSGEYIVTQAASGDHAITFQTKFMSMTVWQADIFVGGTNTPHYYRVRKIDHDDKFQTTEFIVNETSQQAALQAIKELHRR
jgi:hypothetical protein